MNNSQELANAIERFVNKYWQIPLKVEWPKWEFDIVGVGQVTINEKSIENVGNLHTFKGSAIISITDSSQVKTNKKYTIIGNASITFKHKEKNNEDNFPTVNHVIITKIEEY